VHSAIYPSLLPADIQFRNNNSLRFLQGVSCQKLLGCVGSVTYQILLIIFFTDMVYN